MPPYYLHIIFLLSPYYLLIISILSPYYLHIISILSPYYLLIISPRHPPVLPIEGELEGVWAVSLVLVSSTTSGAAAVDDEGCIAVGHLEGTSVGAVAFSQGD